MIAVKENGEYDITQFTKRELEEKIKDVSSTLTFLAFKDRWTGADYQRDRECTIFLKELKNELAARGSSNRAAF